MNIREIDWFILGISEDIQQHALLAGREVSLAANSHSH